MSKSSTARWEQCLTKGDCALNHHADRRQGSPPQTDHPRCCGTASGNWWSPDTSEASKDSVAATDPHQKWLVRCTREAIRVNWHRAGGCALPARFRLRIRRQGFLGRLCRARYKSTQPTNKLTLSLKH